MSFYVVLPSNSSMNFFPNNTLSNYTTKLQNPITVDGPYEVALTEIIFPFNWTSEVKGTVKFGKIGVVDYLKIDIATKRVNTNDELARSIQKEIALFKSKYPEHRGNSSFTYNIAALRFNIYLEKEFYIEFDKDSREYFGTDLVRYEGVNSTGIKQKYNVINNLNMIYIYSDICSYQHVGDTFAPLLNVVAVPNNIKYGDYIDIIYNTPHYIPIVSNVLDTIEIDLRTDTGEKIHFETGKVFIKLHFRPKSYF